MFLVNKFKVNIAAASEVAAIAADRNAGGSYEGAISGINAVTGTLTAIADGDLISPVPTVPGQWDYNCVQNKYEVIFTTDFTATDKPHDFKIPQSIFNIGPNETVEDFVITNIFDPVTKDITNLLPGLTCLYKASKQAFFFTVLHINKAAYIDKGLKITITYKPAN